MRRMQPDPGPSDSTRWVLAFATAITAVKAVLSAQLELTSVEAYHWMYAQHPALGYFDHPAMIGWLVWLSTAIFGHSPLGVRMLTLLGGGVGIWLAFLAGRRLFDDRTGRTAAVLVGVVPAMLGFGVRAQPDAPLLLFWTATIWALVHALSGDRAAWWYAAGLFLGLSMLSKYTAIFLPFGVLLFLALSPDHRRWLARPQPYLACLVALVVFSPTLVWNAQNGWQSLQYQGLERFGERQHRIAWKEFRDFPVSQLLLLTPAVCVLTWGLGLRALRRWRTADWRDRLLAALGVPMLAFFAGMILLRTVRGHWPIPGYVSLLILLAARQDGLWTRRLTLGSARVLAVLVALAPVVLAFVPSERLSGWSHLAVRVRALSPDFVLARDYHDASQLGYLLRTPAACDFTAVGRPHKAFRTWWHAEDFRGRTAVAVFDEKRWPDGLDLVRASFERVDEPVVVTVPRFGSRDDCFMLVRATGYRPPP